MIKLILNFLYIILILSTPIIATPFALITDLGSSAQTIGKGNVEGFNETASVIFENPAGLYQTNQYSWSIMRTTVISEVNYTSIAISGKTPVGRMAFGYYEAAVTDIPETAINNTAESIKKEFYIKGYFDYKNSIYKASYQTSFSDNLHFGANYSIFSHKYYKINGKGYDFDLGFIYNHSLATLSLSAQNILPSSKVVYDLERSNPEELLPQYTLSAHIPIKSIHIYPQVKMAYKKPLLSIGLSYKPSFFPYLELLGGYRQKLSYTLEKRSNITLGLTCNIHGIRLSYAYEPIQYFKRNHQHYFSIGQTF
ncbi:hypothetical protein DID75_04355 [Candidatus Marinamargulisbacteria bacterium SCGC AG-410-N11]|nr:hypothetical protein DID75_04355 [Candidatus Marinamargulisbacteria bacterium SCGC AG-410-N11]